MASIPEDVRDDIEILSTMDLMALTDITLQTDATIMPR
jgi:hypothetical protein